MFLSMYIHYIEIVHWTKRKSYDAMWSIYRLVLSSHLLKLLLSLDLQYICRFGFYIFLENICPTPEWYKYLNKNKEHYYNMVIK